MFSLLMFTIFKNKFYIFFPVVEWFTMASMPFGRHAVQKVRANMNLTSNATTNSSKRQKDNSMNHKFTTDQCK